MKTKRSMGDLMEVLFDGFYLIVCIGLGVFTYMSHGSSSAGLKTALMILTLGIGDSFHLIPRMLGKIHNDLNKRTQALGRGKQITSITMTVFYVLLYGVLAPEEAFSGNSISLAVYLSALVRIVLCLLPSNGWEKGGDQNFTLVMVRNLVFSALGILVLGTCIQKGQIGMAVCIALSFVCYWGTILGVRKNPKLGMLMIPKTIAYLVLIVLALQLL